MVSLLLANFHSLVTKKNWKKISVNLGKKIGENHQTFETTNSEMKK